jgi:hypothetical protein
MDSIIAFLRHRLLERTTWMGLVALLGAVGVTLSPEAAEAVAVAGVAVAGAVFIFFPETGVAEKTDGPAAGGGKAE